MRFESSFCVATVKEKRIKKQRKKEQERERERGRETLPNKEREMILVKLVTCLFSLIKQIY